MIAFSNQAELLPDLSIFDRPVEAAELRQQLDKPLWSDDSAQGGSALQEALQLAGAQIPQNGRGDIELFPMAASREAMPTPKPTGLPAGNFNQGDARRCRSPQSADCRAAELVTVASAQVGQTIGLELNIESTRATTVHATVYENNAVAGNASHSLQIGENHFTIQVPLTTAGLASFSASLAFEGGNAETVSSPLAAVSVEQASRCLSFTDGADHSTSDALAAILGNSVQLETIAPVEMARRSLKDFSAIVLADTPADVLSAGHTGTIKQAVNDGAGLLITGAARSFGPGGYADFGIGRCVAGDNAAGHGHD